MRQPLIVGNWKMNKTQAEAAMLARDLAEELRDVTSADVVLCPPFTALSVVGDAICDTNIMLGAQNMHWETAGAFTGEISALFLAELGCSYVILGHSERRVLCHESDAEVARKLKTALVAGLTPIVCVGETLAERKANRTNRRLKEQFLEGIAPVLRNEGEKSGIRGQGSDPDTRHPTPDTPSSPRPSDRIVLAYEPIWAIGTGEAASPEQAAEVHQFLRELAAKEIGSAWAEGLTIIYGGSVTPENIDRLMVQPGIDGVLVGGASLKRGFVRIVKFQGQ